MYVFNHKGSKLKLNISYQYFILTFPRLLKTLELEHGKLALNVDILIDYCMNESIKDAIVTAINLLLSQNTVIMELYFILSSFLLALYDVRCKS